MRIVSFKLFMFMFFVMCFKVQSQERVDGRLVSDKSLVQTNAVHDYIDIYQKYISGLKSGQCAMYPSCSNYGLMVFEKYPFFKAMAMTSDRQMRCSHDQSFYDITYYYVMGSCIDLPDNFTPPPLSKFV